MAVQVPYRMLPRDAASASQMVDRLNPILEDVDLRLKGGDTLALEVEQIGLQVKEDAARLPNAGEFAAALGRAEQLESQVGQAVDSALEAKTAAQTASARTEQVAAGIAETIGSLESRTLEKIETAIGTPIRARPVAIHTLSVPLSSPPEVLGGRTMQVGDLVLLPYQVPPRDSGLYKLAQNGTLVRSSEMAAGASITTSFFVKIADSAPEHASETWELYYPGTVRVGTSAQSWRQQANFNTNNVYSGQFPRAAATVDDPAQPLAPGPLLWSDLPGRPNFAGTGPVYISRLFDLAPYVEFERNHDDPEDWLGAFQRVMARYNTIKVATPRMRWNGPLDLTNVSDKTFINEGAGPVTIVIDPDTLDGVTLYTAVQLFHSHNINFVGEWCFAYANPPLVLSLATTSGSTSAVVPDARQLTEGLVVALHGGVPAGTTIVSIAGNTLTLSAAATASLLAPARFADFNGDTQALRVNSDCQNIKLGRMHFAGFDRAVYLNNGPLKRVFGDLSWEGITQAGLQAQATATKITECEFSLRGAAVDYGLGDHLQINRNIGDEGVQGILIKSLAVTGGARGIVAQTSTAGADGADFADRPRNVTIMDAYVAKTASHAAAFRHGSGFSGRIVAEACGGPVMFAPTWQGGGDWSIEHRKARGKGYLDEATYAPPMTLRHLATADCSQTTPGAESGAVIARPRVTVQGGRSGASGIGAATARGSFNYKSVPVNLNSLTITTAVGAVTLQYRTTPASSLQMAVPTSIEDAMRKAYDAIRAIQKNPADAAYPVLSTITAALDGTNARLRVAARDAGVAGNPITLATAGVFADTTMVAAVAITPTQKYGLEVRAEGVIVSDAFDTRGNLNGGVL